MRAALYCSKICSYAQGMAMLSAANKAYNYGMHLDEIARIWKAGCIIRAVFLDEIKKAFKEEPDLPNLLLAGRFREAVNPRQDAWRRVLDVGDCRTASRRRRSARSLAYYDSYRRERVPANLIQAQRDFFGAHTYERTDKPGVVPHRVGRADPAGQDCAEAHEQDKAQRHEVTSAVSPGRTAMTHLGIDIGSSSVKAACCAGAGGRDVGSRALSHHA